MSGDILSGLMDEYHKAMGRVALNGKTIGSADPCQQANKNTEELFRYLWGRTALWVWA